jgi:Uncharacterized protein conserved in cyanobacteria
MRASIITPPRTAMEVFQMLPEGTLAEVIENQLFMSPSPTPYHQEVSGNLFIDLGLHIRTQKSGKIFCAPIDLYLEEGASVVQPDILFFSKKNSVIINNKGLHGVPDLIIEVLSPGNKKYDLIKKKKLYEKSGVKEYWVVDPETRVSTGFTLKSKVYQTLGQFKSKVVIALFKKSFEF